MDASRCHADVNQDLLICLMRRAFVTFGPIAGFRTYPLTSNLIRQSLPPLLTPSGKISKRKRPLIGKISGGKNAPSGIIDVATYQSLVIKGGESEGHFVKDLS